MKIKAFGFEFGRSILDELLEQGESMLSEYKSNKDAFASMKSISEIVRKSPSGSDDMRASLEKSELQTKIDLENRLEQTVTKIKSTEDDSTGRKKDFLSRYESAAESYMEKTLEGYETNTKAFYDDIDPFRKSQTVTIKRLARNQMDILSDYLLEKVKKPQFEKYTERVKSLVGEYRIAKLLNEYTKSLKRGDAGDKKGALASSIRENIDNLGQEQRERVVKYLKKWKK